MASLKGPLYPPYETIQAHITKAAHAMKMECSTIIIIVILGCIISILSRSLIWVFTHK